MDAEPSLSCPPELPLSAEPDCALERAVPSSVMGLLRDHLPLTLLLDLALGVRSDEVYANEPADVSWVPSRVA